MRLDTQLLIRIQRLTSCNLLARSYSTAQPHQKEKLKYKYPKVKSEYPPGRWDEENIKPKAAWKVFEEGEKIKSIPKVIDRLEHIAGEEECRFFYVTPGRNYTRAKLEYEQFLTQTHLINNGKLPDIYENLEYSKYLDRTKSLLEQSFDLQKFQYRNLNSLSQIDQKHQIAQASFKQLLGNLLPEISSKYKHLWTCQLDENVLTQAFWDRGPIIQTDDDGDLKKVVKFRNPDNLSIRFAVLGEADFQIRTEDPLPNFIDMESETCTLSPIPYLPVHPLCHGYHSQVGRRKNVNGHLLGDPCEFTHLRIHILKDSIENGEKLDDWDILHCGLMSSFSSTMAQAHNNGFNMFNDLPFPFVTQTLVTNGEWVQGFSYQLNNMKLWQKDGLRNICWSTPKLNLKDAEGISLLMKFLVQKTQYRENSRIALPEDPSPASKEKFINFKGEEELPYQKLERYQAPKKALYY
ncbi:DgyrCDS5073 [Dimorphilus gyrociliatus]|uniref:DgyrCDS5073 n=1 Tax=Dimorphilus gyrociliatus TaxID=2664684 RepID=A0A7I8VIN9_9ANNE|nr:DgyrCDS5073 [Dimorphilus gyrociliatus]